MKHTHKNAFTLIELLVVISIIALLIGILLPSLASARVAARQMKDNTQLRGFQQGCFIYAQDNKGAYPGLTPDGKFVLGRNNIRDNFTGVTGGNRIGQGRDVWVRFGILIDQGIITPEYAISPGETDPNYVVWDASDPAANPLGQINCSYSMLAIGAAGNNTNALRSSWSDLVEGGVPIASARNLTREDIPGGFAAAGLVPESVWTEEGSEEWTGGVVWNDGHVNFENDDTLDETIIDFQRNQEDRLFTQSEETDGGRQGKNVLMNPAAAPAL